MAEQSLRFEDAMSKLEQIVQKLEAGEVPLEDAITLYKEGMELSAYCQGKLQDAEKQMISIMQPDGKEQPFEPTEGETSNG